MTAGCIGGAWDVGGAVGTHEETRLRGRRRQFDIVHKYCIEIRP
jgi:hypothetical protein